MAMKELQEFPKIPSELMERLMNLTLRYFKERSRVSCMYLSFLIIIMGRGSIVVRAHASRAEGLRFESDSMP